MLPSPANALGGRDLLKDFRDGSESALYVAATKVFDAAGQAESATISAAATLQSIDESFPRNCSLGTKRFCIGYEQDVSCSGLPLNPSSLLPESVGALPSPVQSAIRVHVKTLSPLVESLTRFPALFVLQTLASGLISMSIVAALSLCLALGWPRDVTKVFNRLSAFPRALALLALGLVCCSPFVLLGVVLTAILKSG